MKSRSGAARTFQVVYKKKPSPMVGRHLIGVPTRRLAAVADAAEPAANSAAAISQSAA